MAAGSACWVCGAVLKQRLWGERVGREDHWYPQEVGQGQGWMQKKFTCRAGVEAKGLVLGEQSRGENLQSSYKECWQEWPKVLRQGNHGMSRHSRL